MRMNRLTKALLVLRTTDQLATINSLVPDWHNEPVFVVSGHPTVDIELRRLGMPFESIYDTVPVNLFEDSETEVNELTGTFASILRQLWPNEPLMIEGLCPNAHIVAQDIVRSRISIETLFQKLNPQAIWIVSSLSIPRVLEVVLSSDIFDAMLLQGAENKGIPARLIQKPVPALPLWLKFRQRLGKSMLGPFLRQLLRWFATLKSHPKQALVIPPKTSRRRIMLLGSDFDFENQLPLVRKINEGSSTEAIHVFMSDPYNWMQPNTYRYMAENPEAWLDYQQFARCYPTSAIVYKPSSDFREEFRKVGPKWQGWLASPYLEFQFKWLFESAPLSI